MKRKRSTCMLKYAQILLIDHRPLLHGDLLSRVLGLDLTIKITIKAQIRPYSNITLGAASNRSVHGWNHSNLTSVE